MFYDSIALEKGALSICMEKPVSTFHKMEQYNSRALSIFIEKETIVPLENQIEREIIRLSHQEHGT